MNKDLAIKHVTVTEVSIRMTRTCTWSLGRSYGHTRSIVEAETAGGIVGLGEAPTPKVAPLIRESFAARLVGTRAAKLAMVEEPVALLQEMERPRADFPTPISTHCTDPEKLRGFPIIDGIVGDLNVDGGVRGVSRTATVIRSMGKRFWLRSKGETGIGGAALCHLGMACPELDRPAQWLGNWCEDDLIEGEPWHVRHGGIMPPEAPGLGVTIDRTALAHYSGKFKTDGAFSRYDKP